MKKYLLYVLAVAVVAVGFPAVFALANYNNGEGINVGVRLDACNKEVCEVSDWNNYSIDAGGDSQTLIAQPGETITFKHSAWNDGSLDVIPYFSESITNSTYLEHIVAFGATTDDIDGNSVLYVAGSQMESGGTHNINSTLSDILATTKDNSDPEIGEVKATIKSDTPDQTLIIGTFWLGDYGTPEVTFLGADKVYAQSGPLTTSTVRILVSNPSTPTPTPTPTPSPIASTPIPTSTPAILPKTGAHAE